MSIEDLNKKYGIQNNVEFFSGKGGWPYAKLTTKKSESVVSVYGAHVLNFVPKNTKDLLWKTDQSFYEQGKPIRGGIPICWPWFGPHPTDSGKPMHGFARISMWEIVKTSVKENGSVQLVLGLSDSDYTKAIWPFSFEAQLSVTINESLTVELSIENTDTKEFSFTDALHSYLLVGDASQITIEGLEGASYHDGLENNKLKQQPEKILRINKEENRRYINTSSTCNLADPVLKRKIIVKKHNSNTTVVWNPWIETAKSFADLDDEGYKTMVCIETANAFNEVINLPPKEKFSVCTIISTEE